MFYWDRAELSTVTRNTDKSSHGLSLHNLTDEAERGHVSQAVKIRSPWTINSVLPVRCLLTCTLVVEFADYERYFSELVDKEYHKKAQQTSPHKYFQIKLP